MLSTEIFKEFVIAVNTAQYNFRLWMYMNNGWVPSK